MLIFIDESGDPGMKLGPGCSDYFLVTLVIFQFPAEAMRVEHCIRALRRELRMHPQAEFHFSKLSHERRERFLAAVSRFQWVYVTAALNKHGLYGPGFKVPDSFYKFTCGLAFDLIKGHVRRATVVIDRSGNRKFRDELNSYLRRRLEQSACDDEPVIDKLKMEDSHRNDLLQMADMVCGAAARSLNFPEEKARFRRLILTHEMVPLRIWPKK